MDDDILFGCLARSAVKLRPKIWSSEGESEISSVCEDDAVVDGEKAEDWEREESGYWESW